MTSFNIGHNAAKTIVYVSQNPEPLPGGATVALTDFDHDHEDDLVHPFDGNHVLFHHVRDALYPLGVLDMQRVKIEKSGNIWGATGIRAAAPDDDIVVAATHTLVIEYVSDKAEFDVATNTHFTYQSSDATKATVSAAGVITGVAAGTANITISQANTGFSVVVPVTVVAA